MAVRWVPLVLNCIGWGIALAMIPVAVVVVLIEHYQPHIAWRVAGWTVVVAIFLTPLALGLVVMLTR